MGFLRKIKRETEKGFKKLLPGVGGAVGAALGGPPGAVAGVAADHQLQQAEYAKADKRTEIRQEAAAQAKQRDDIQKRQESADLKLKKEKKKLAGQYSRSLRAPRGASFSTEQASSPGLADKSRTLG